MVKRNKETGTVHAILATLASLDQRSLWLKITGGLDTYFIQNTKRSPNRSRAWKECIR